MGCAGSAAARYEEPVAEAAPEQPVEAAWPRGEWRVEVAQDDWIALDQETSQRLLEEYYGGQTEASYSSFNNSYHVDFYSQTQTDQQTGRQCRICWFEASEAQTELAGQEEMAAAPEVYLGGEWLIEESSDVWKSLDPEVSAQLLVAYYCGDERMEYTLEGKSYEVDLTSWEQLSRESGKRQRIFWNSSDPQAAETEAPDLPDSRRESEASEQWLEPGEEAERQLLSALASGQEVVRYFVNGCEFEVDVVRLVQTNLTTGEQWMIALEGGEVPAPAPAAMATEPMQPAAAEVAPEASTSAEPAAASDGSAAFAAGASEPRAVPTARGKPKAFIYKAAPDATKAPPKKKKWSLAPGQQRTRIAGPKPKAAPGPQRPGPPGPAPAAKAAIELPKGVEWPKADKARRVAETVFQDMRKSQKKPLSHRRRAYMAACLSWHPDKNLKHQEVATEVFQFLQAVKDWYFEEGR